jgi:myo-inositol 2-dehydrogenase/D-chiro-inositol 1-dehydrogenase
MTSDHVGIGIVGSGFIAGAHAEAFARLPRATVRAVASRSAGRAAEFAGRWGVPAWLTDFRELADRPDVDVVCIAAPNALHRDIAVAAAQAGKHVICEKPLARTLREADEMISACAAAGVLLMYAEEICFAPKYVRAKELADEGALGEVYLVRQTEQHFGPHSDWFWDPEQAGGGVLMDMGCHGIEFARWVLGKPAARTVAAEVGIVRGEAVPQETGPDGRTVLELIYAAYRAARVGRVELPLELSEQEAAQPPFALL